MFLLYSLILIVILKIINRVRKNLQNHTFSWIFFHCLKSYSWTILPLRLKSWGWLVYQMLNIILLKIWGYNMFRLWYTSLIIFGKCQKWSVKKMIKLMNSRILYITCNFLHTTNRLFLLSANKKIFYDIKDYVTVFLCEFAIYLLIG